MSNGKIMQLNQEFKSNSIQHPLPRPPKKEEIKSKNKGHYQKPKQLTGSFAAVQWAASYWTWVTVADFHRLSNWDPRPWLVGRAGLDLNGLNKPHCAHRPLAWFPAHPWPIGIIFFGGWYFCEQHWGFWEWLALFTLDWQAQTEMRQWEGPLGIQM